MSKKAIAILGAIFLLIVGTLGFLVFLKYSKKSTDTAQLASVTQTQPTKPGNPVPLTNNNNPSSQNNNPPGTTPTSAGGAIKLSSQAVVSPVLYFNGNGMTYFDSQGNLYRSDFSDTSGQLRLSNTKSFAIQAKAGISKVLWPKKGNDFMAEFDSIGKRSWSYFNSATGKYLDLPPQVVSVDWLPAGDQIIYVWLDNGKASLNISQPDTSGWQKIADMWETDDNLSVSPDGLNVLYYELNSTTTPNPINLVTPDGKLWKSLVKDGFNYGVLWSPDGKKFLFNKKDTTSQQWQLWLYDLTSNTQKNLGVSTSIDKVAWDNISSKVYAAVSATAGSGAMASDQFYQLDPVSLTRKQYSAGSALIDAHNLFLNLSGDKLFFQNNQDGALYYLDLSASQ